MPRELTDAEVFGGGELSDEQVFGDQPNANRRTSQGLGFMEGVGRVMLNYDRANPLNAFDTQAYRDAAGQAKQNMLGYFAQREQTERPGMIGRIAGEATATAPIAAITRNPYAVGAIGGAAATDANDLQGVLGDAALGAVFGKLGDVAVRGTANALKPVVDPAVTLLKNAGVKLTPGQMRGGKAMTREDKMMSRPIVGEKIQADRNTSLLTFNTAAINRALDPLNIKLPASLPHGFDAVDEAHRVVTDAYDAVVPKLRVQVDPRFVAGLRQVWGEVQLLPEAQQKQFQSLLNDVRFGPNGTLAAESLKKVQSKIGTKGRKYFVSQDPDQSEFGSALLSLKEHLDDMIVRQNPRYGDTLRAVNKAFRGLVTVEDAASRADDGVFSTGQLKQAVRRGDSSKRKTASARGQAYMQDFSNAARTVLPAKAPNPSGTAAHMQSGSLIGNVRGAADLAGYNVRKALGDALSGRAGPAAQAAAHTLLKLNPGLVLAAGLLPGQTE